MKLGKLKKVDLRDYWKHEAFDFTKWLSEKDNLEELSDEIGIGIELIQTEANVGRFHVDILAQEENTGRKIIIENQLEMTDHSHLGQIITYAAVIEADYILWIVREDREEHRQAIDWLNEHTDERINFFLIRIELWQIGDSIPAPKFIVICRPNDWTKSVRDGAQDGNLSDTKTTQLEFWQQFRQFVAEQNPELKLRKPYPQHWYDMAIGRSDCHVTFTIYKGDGKIGCELYIPSSKELFRDLYSRREEIKNELGLNEDIDWQELPEKKACRIRTYHSFDFSKKDEWIHAFLWLTETGAKFKKTFNKNWCKNSV